MREFSDKDIEILQLVQGDLPDSATPFADIAAKAGVEPDAVLSLLASMKEDGAIRRFGATLRHQKAGYGANAMVAWRIESEEELLRIGKDLAADSRISHCYYRLPQPTWPYNLYTMVHGKSREECLATVEALAERAGNAERLTLFSVKELKKTSMAYF